MAAGRKRCLAVLFTISVFYWIFTSVIQSPRFTNDYEFFISVSSLYISIDIATSILLTILLFIDCSKMARIRINTRTHTKEKPYLIKDLSQFQWKSAHAPKKELPKDFL